MTVFYPEINIDKLNFIATKLEEDPAYLDHPSCPYPDSIRKLLKPQVSEDEVVHDFDLDSLTSEDGMLNEIQSLYTHLQKFGEQMRESTTSSEKNTYFKLSASLLEKLIDMKERVINVKKMTEFSDTVLRIMEEELNADQRTNIMKKLREVLDQ